MCAVGFGLVKMKSIFAEILRVAAYGLTANATNNFVYDLVVNGKCG